MPQYETNYGKESNWFVNKKRFYWEHHLAALWSFFSLHFCWGRECLTYNKLIHVQPWSETVFSQAEPLLHCRLSLNDFLLHGKPGRERLHIKKDRGRKRRTEKDKKHNRERKRWLWAAKHVCVKWFRLVLILITDESGFCSAQQVLQPELHRRLFALRSYFT